jgi:hypothetical protein
MYEYYPDRWVIVKLTNKKGISHNRVFAGWYGGYTGGDSWKLNSGIVAEEVTEDYYDFVGDSGSVYRCYKNAYGMSGYMASVLANWQSEENPTVTIEIYGGKYEAECLRQGSKN